MATPGRAPLPNAAPAAIPPTPALLLSMLQVSTHVSDLIFSPGCHPHVEVSGQLVPVKLPGLPVLSPDATQRIAEELIGSNQQAAATLKQQGSCDISYSLPRHRALPRECLRATGKPRHRDARDPQEHPHFCGTETAGGTRPHCRHKERHRSSHWPHWFGKILDAGGHSGSH